MVAKDGLILPQCNLELFKRQTLNRCNFVLLAPKGMCCFSVHLEKKFETRAGDVNRV